VVRISIVTNSVSGGGAEKAMNILGNELHKRGFDISIIAINKSIFSLSEIGCNLSEIKRNWNGGIFDTVSSWLKFKNVIKNLKSDLLILNCDLPEFFGSILVRKTKIICVEHSQYPWRTRPLFGKIIRVILRFKKVTWVAVSNHLSIWPNGLKPDKVIPNPISENTSILPMSGDLIKRLVFIGRLSWEKNPQEIINIAKLVNFPVLFIGEGIDKEELSKMASTNKVETKMVGFKEKPWELIESGDLLLVPSRYEGDGLVVVEALQRNVPLLISNIPEFLRFDLPKHNYACKDTDYSNLILTNKSDLSKFIVSPSIANKALSQRDIETVCSSWSSLINDILISK
jgi:glycosyltransferase involved in cell wall biosynthesis